MKNKKAAQETLKQSAPLEWDTKNEAIERLIYYTLTTHDELHSMVGVMDENKVFRAGAIIGERIKMTQALFQDLNKDPLFEVIFKKMIDKVNADRKSMIDKQENPMLIQKQNYMG